MSLDAWLSFLVAATILCVTPGPTVLLVVGQSLHHGKASALPLVSGVLVGDLIAMTLSVAGLGAVLAMSAFWFTLLKWLGAAYLVYLGVRMWMTKHNVDTSSCVQQLNRSSIFRDALLVTALNPKGIVFFVAFFPLFITPENPIVPQVLILMTTMLLVSAVCAIVYAVCATRVRHKVDSPSAQKVFNRTGASMLIGAGVMSAILQR